MNKIILIGGGGHCKSTIDVIEQEARFEIAGIIDKPKLLGSKILGYPVIGNDFDLENLAKKYQNALVTVGQIKSAFIRIKLYDLAIKAGFTLPTMGNVIVNADTSIGDNCIINSKALIEHDCLISNHCHISTNAIINGGVKIGSNCFIGSNVTTKDNIIIKENSFIKAGSVVK